MQNIDWKGLSWNNPVGGAAVATASFTGKNEVFANYGIGVGDVIAFPPVEMLDQCRFTQKSKSLGVDVSLLKVVRKKKFCSTPCFSAISKISCACLFKSLFVNFLPP